MKKHIIRSLQIATLAVGVTATALAGAKTDKSHSSDKQHENSLCITINGDNTDATTLLLVDKAGNAHGAVCYSSDYFKETYEDCHAVKGQVYGTTDIRVSLIGVGLDHIIDPLADVLNQTDVAINLENIFDWVGKGSADTRSPNQPLLHNATSTGTNLALRRNCSIDQVNAAFKIAIDMSKILPEEPTHTLPHGFNPMPVAIGTACNQGVCTAF